MIDPTRAVAATFFNRADRSDHRRNESNIVPFVQSEWSAVHSPALAVSDKEKGMKHASMFLLPVLTLSKREVNGLNI